MKDHYLLGFLFELFDDTLVDTTAFVDEMAGRSRLARVDVTDDDDVNVELFFSHFGLIVVNKYNKCKGGMNSKNPSHFVLIVVNKYKPTRLFLPRKTKCNSHLPTTV